MAKREVVFPVQRLSKEIVYDTATGVGSNPNRINTRMLTSHYRLQTTDIVDFRKHILLQTSKFGQARNNNNNKVTFHYKSSKRRESWAICGHYLMPNTTLQ